MHRSLQEHGRRRPTVWRPEVEGHARMMGQGPPFGARSVDRALMFAMDVPNDPSSIAFVRRGVTSVAEMCGPEAAASVGLVFSELVTNALVHGHLGAEDRIRVEFAITPDGMKGSVCDPGIGFTQPSDPEPGVDGGFGLFIVQRLVGRWGVDTERDVTRVWVEF